MNRKRYAAEFIGTFALVFCSTAAIAVENQFGIIGHAGVAAVAGLIVMVMIYTLGDISGAHINPAVSVAFAMAGVFPLQRLLPYMLSQFSGAFAASGLVLFLFPADETLGATLPSGTVIQSFILEVLLAFLLVFVILSVSQGSKERGIMAGAAIGSTVLLAALFAGPVSGASMNPARSLAPAVASGHTENLWIYLTAPFAGAALAVTLSKMMAYKQGNETS